MEQEGTDGTVSAQQHPERVRVMQDYFDFWKVHLGPHLIQTRRERGRKRDCERREREINLVRIQEL